MDHDARVDGRRRASASTPRGKFDLLFFSVFFIDLAFYDRFCYLKFRKEEVSEIFLEKRRSLFRREV